MDGLDPECKGRMKTVLLYRDCLSISFDLTVVNLQAGYLVHPSNLNRWDASNSTLSRRWRPLRSTGPTTEGVSDHGGSRAF